MYSPGASYVIEVVTNFRGCRLPTAAVSSSMIRTQACRNSGNRYIADVIVRHRNPRLSAWCEAHVAGVNIDAKVHESAPGGTLPCVSRSLLSLRGDAGAKDPAFASRKGGHLTVRRQWCGQAHSQEGRHQRGRITALAAPRARLACHRPGRLAARGAVDAGPRQHRHHIRLTARPTQHVGRPAPGSGSVPSMRTGAVN